jgi:hypothetical protein
MSGYLNQEKAYYEGYYSGLVGATVTSVECSIEDGAVWTKIMAVNGDGDDLELEVSRDPEGNGPGFIFGLPDPGPVSSGKSEN